MLSNRALKAAFLIVLIIISFVATSGLVNGQAITAVQTSSIDSTASQSDNSNLTDVLDQRYLGLLGLDYNATQINSSVNSTIDAGIKGYSYIANLTSNSKSYFVESTQYETINANQTILTTTQRISGSANSNCVSTENNTTVNNLIISQEDLTLLSSNCSGNYELAMNSLGSYDSETSALVNVQAEVDQNFSDPIGNYSIALSPLKENDSFNLPNAASSVFEPELNLSITAPDGKQSIATLIPNSSTGQLNTFVNNSPMDSGSHPPVGDFTVPVPNDISWTLLNPLLSTQGSHMLTGFFIYWDDAANDLTGFILGAFTLIGGLLITPSMGTSFVIFTVFSVVSWDVLGLAQFFKANLSGESVHIMYF